MRRITLPVIMILGMAVAFAAQAQPKATGETIKVLADAWCPYTCDPKSDRPGLMIEIATQAFAKHGITVKYDLHPWERAIEVTRRGEYHAIVGAAKTDAPDFIYPRVPQGWVRNAFYVKKGSPWRFTGMDSLEKISLGATIGYSYTEEMDAYIARHKNNMRQVQELAGDDVLDTHMKKLLMGRLGAVIESEYVMRYYLQQKNLMDKIDGAGSLPSDTSTEAIYLAFAPKHPDSKRYADILAKETEALRASGALKKILDAYNVPDWQ